MTLQEKQNELIDSYSVIEDPLERFQIIVDSGASKLRGFPKEYQIDENLVEGCQSSVWLVGKIEPDTGLFDLQMDSDAPALKGVVALFAELYSGVRPDEVIEVEPEFLDRLGISGILTTTRRRGLGFVRAKIVQLAGQRND